MYNRQTLLDAISTAIEELRADGTLKELSEMCIRDRSGAARAPCISLYTTPLTVPSALRCQPSCSNTLLSTIASGQNTAFRCV